jgi:hypothetical protein
MSEDKNKKKIRDTKLGQWLKEKAPGILDAVGDLLPDQGGLGVVKNLLDKEPDISPEEAKAMVDAEIAYQNNVTERWKADMGSDVKIAKVIRPLMLVTLTCIFLGLVIFDSLDNQPFNVKDSYVSLLEILMLTVFGAYFAGRTVEKTRKL